MQTNKQDWENFNVTWSGSTKKLHKIAKDQDFPFIARVAKSRIKDFSVGEGPDLEYPILFYKKRKKQCFKGK